MKMKKLWRSRKALSPVIAAIILIAVTVAVSIAVAAWMGALTFTFMGYEDLEISAVDWTWVDGTLNTVKITVKNVGTRDVTINRVEVNHAVTSVGIPTPALPIPFTTTAYPDGLDLTFTYPYVNGSSYDIAVVTSGNYEFSGLFTGGEDA